jgi:outer membrane protein insertion porin family
MRRAPVVAALLVVLGPARAGAEVEQYLGRRVVSLRLEAEGRNAADPRLLGIVETRLGSPLSMVAVRESIAHLFSLGRFEDVRVRAEAGERGVALVYELVPVHPVTRISFEGVRGVAGIDPERLQTALVDRFGSSPPIGRSADMARLVEDELRARGYLRARVTPQVSLEHDPDRATLVFRVDPGVRARIGEVQIVGSPEEPPGDLLERLEIASGAPYEREVLNERADRYVAERRARGHYEARLMTTARLVDEDRVANLTLTVIPGPRVQVVFEGDALPAGVRDELVPIAREGSTDEDLLEDSSNSIEAYLRAQGFRDAVAPYAREASDGELRITFTVQRGPRYRVADVVLAGNTAIGAAELEPVLQVREGQPFQAALLDEDVSTIADLYRRRGFAAVAVASDVLPMEPDAAPGGSAPRRDNDSSREERVRVRIAVTENVRTLVGSVRIDGAVSVDEAELRRGLGLRSGEPYYAPQLAVDRERMRAQYANLGYLSASVAVQPGLTEDGGRADVTFTVQEGPRIFVDHVLIVGNTRTSTATIERALLIRPGDPLGVEAVVESQRRLAALGLFRRARITRLDHGDETTRDVVVTVEEAPVTTIGYGGGLEAGQFIRAAEGAGVASERLEVAPRAFFEVGRRNLFGRNRSVNLFTRISLRPGAAAPGQGPESEGSFGFSEYRILGTFREPNVGGTAADASLTGTAEQQRRSSFNFARRAFSAQVGRRVHRYGSVTGNYQIQRTELFDEQFSPEDELLIDRLFPQILLSSFSLAAIHDTRDDAIDPVRGQYLSVSGQLAARRIGSQVGFIKSYITAQRFQPLPLARRVVFASSARFGLASGFAREVLRTGADGAPVRDGSGTPIVDVLTDLPASERFFAGGDTTVRGFALDQLGTGETIDQNGFPIGGNALMIFNAELRVRIAGGLGVVGFFDAGNVFARVDDLDLWRMRSALGGGLRYLSPVGPIRVDVGLKLNRRDIVPGRPERLSAVHISLGQAF